MEYSSLGLSLTKRYEGLSLRPYKDVAGFWTIGYGHRSEEEPEPITEAWANLLLEQDIQGSVQAVNTLVKVPLNQNQFDALVDFVFNAGAGNFAKSTLLKKINAQDYAGAADEFQKWCYAGHEMVPGLLRRREDERALFLTQ